MSEHGQRQETEVKAPLLVVEEHDGSQLLSIPRQGIEKQLVKGMAYGVLLADGRVLWHWIGDFMAAAEGVASILENNPGMPSIVSGILEARMAARVRRSSGQG